MLEDGETEDFERALRQYSLSNEAELMRMIANLQAKVEKTRQKIVAASSQEENVVIEEKPKLKSSLQPKEHQDFDEWLSSAKKERYYSC